MIATLILAAGGSSRMGSPKQLLDWKGKPLIRRVTEPALSFARGPVAVVLGAVVDPVKLALDGLPVEFVQNPNWHRGLGTSLRAGVDALTRTHCELHGILVLLCDQPCIPAEHYENLLSASERSPRAIVASGYGDGAGVPAIFPAWAFSEISALPDEAGAKKIIARHAPASVITVDAPEASFDIDTPDDYRSYFSKSL